jgi:hypothetical protein
VREKLRVKLHDDWISGGYKMWLYKHRSSGHGSIFLKPIQMEFIEVREAEPLPEPTFKVSKEEGFEIFQSVANWLAEQGVRPNTDKLSGQFEILKKHSEFVENNHRRLMDLVDHIIRK